MYFAEINFRMRKILEKFRANVEEISGRLYKMSEKVSKNFKNIRRNFRKNFKET